MPTTAEFREALLARFRAATSAGEESVEVRAGDLHRQLGGYPGPSHQMPSCCAVMHDELRVGDQIVAQPTSGKGASLVVRYLLPRGR